MKFRLIHKKLGVKSIGTFSEFECSNIRDICFINGKFLCLNDNSLLEINDSGCTEVLSIDNPMSICPSFNNQAYIVYNGGIKSVNTLNYYATDAMGLKECKPIFHSLSKIGLRDIYIHTYKNITGFAVSPIHKVYRMKKIVIDKEIGSGIPEYSVSNNLNHSSLSNPQGIVIYDENTIIVSDTGNGCIRSFGKSHSIIAGKPKDSSIAPRKLLLDRKKDILYYLSKNYLKSVLIDGSKDIVLYESETIKSIVLKDDGKVYILEVIEGELWEEKH